MSTLMYLNNRTEIRVHDGVFKLIDGNPQHHDYFINEYGDRVMVFLPDNSRLVFIQDGTDGAEYPLITGPEIKLVDVDEDTKEEAADAGPPEDICVQAAGTRQATSQQARLIHRKNMIRA